MIPRIFYPWIRGPNNEIYDALVAQTGVKINIPPPSAMNEVITITGEKEGVQNAAEAIRKIFEEKRAIAKSVTCQVRRLLLKISQLVYHIVFYMLFLFNSFSSFY